ncbi:MAG: hypothetical protein A2341_18880 [Deltaproteobacteria bacterium RIFOXYB12_FULL_58_9]|nr:MAG: hypothetical protein A2341_18880 [Deltaproteobacteria bacterium RIFOXYB12_FULL_58_9]
MSALVLLAVIAAGQVSGDALAPYRGQTVLSVDVSASEDIDVDELRSLIDIQPGYLLSSDVVGDALKRLYALGRFSDVGVTAERLSGTVSLHFYVRPIRRLDELEIKGLENASETELRRALATKSGSEVDSRTAQRLDNAATDYLRSAGFPAAKVDVSLASAPDAAMVSYVVTVVEGTPTRVHRVRFTGRPRLAPSILSNLVETEEGGILHQGTVETDAKRLRDAYRAHGFLEAEVSTPRMTTEGSQAVVNFPIQAGDHIVIEVEGSTVLTRGDVVALWPTSDNKPQPADLELFAQRLEAHYRQIGFLDAQVTLRSKRDAAKEETIYRLRIREGPIVRVTRIVFPGANAIRPKLLEAQIRSYLSRELETGEFFQRIRAAHKCLAWPRSMDGGKQGCAVPIPDPEDRWITDTYKDALDEITAAYHAIGFRNVKVGPVESRRRENDISVTVPVVEGTQTTIAAIAFSGNEAFTAAELLETVEAAGSEDGVAQRLNAPYSAADIEDARIAILRRYRDLGYLYCHAFTTEKFSHDGRDAEVTFRFEEGPQVHIERILVRGNRYTNDSVIRSRISTKPGDLYRLDRALADQRSIAELGVFSNVRVKIIDEEKPAERKDMVAEVTERGRHSIEGRFGLSSAEGPRVSASYSHNNVLGTASTFSTSLRLNRQLFFGLYGEHSELMANRYETLSAIDQLERALRIGLQSPKQKELPFDPLARIDLVHERENAISYLSDSYSAILGVDFTPTNSLTFSIEPQISYTNIACEELLGTKKCTEELLTQRLSGRRAIDLGARQAVQLSPSITLDKRDNAFNPTRGFYASIKGVYAIGRAQPPAATSASSQNTVSREFEPTSLPAAPSPPPPAERTFSYTRVEARVSAYVPTNGLVLAVSARTGIVGIIDGDVPIDERFFIGGRSTLRGFPEGGTVIPEDACVYDSSIDGDEEFTCGGVPERKKLGRTADEAPLSTGGEFFLLFKVEARIPMALFSDNVSLGFFMDFGNLWIEPPTIKDLSFRVGTGVGIRWASPVGPLALDIGVNTNPKSINGEPSAPLPHFSVTVF